MTSNVTIPNEAYSIIPVIEEGTTVIKFKVLESGAASSYYQVSNSDGTFDIKLVISYLAV